MKRSGSAVADMTTKVSTETLKISYNNDVDVLYQDLFENIM